MIQKMVTTIQLQILPFFRFSFIKRMLPYLFTNNFECLSKFTDDIPLNKPTRIMTGQQVINS